MAGPLGGSVQRGVCIVLAGAALFGCADATGSRSTNGVRPPTITVEPDSSGIVPTLTVTTSAPATIVTDYWADGGDRLRQTTADSAASTIPLLRTHAATTYHYEVHAVAEDGASSDVVTGQVGTLPLPVALAALQFDVTGTATQPLVMLEVSSPFKGFVVVDASGAVVWYWRTVGSAQGFTRLPSGDFLLNDTGTGLVEVTPAADVVRAMSFSGEVYAPHHDVVATSHNSVLFIGHDIRSVNGVTYIGDGIWEWSFDTNAIVQRFSVFDWYDPALDWGNRSSTSDWVHANALAIGPHGNVLLSLNWLDQVVSIAPDFASIEWRLGGRNSTFAQDTDAVFLGQHNAQLLAEDRVLMFDNGRDRETGEPYSRGLEVRLDTVTHAAHMAWAFRPSPTIYAPIIGAVHRLANGNTTVAFGTSSTTFPGATGPIRMYEVTPSGQVVWTLTVTGVSSMYRGTPLSSLGGEAVVP